MKKILFALAALAVTAFAACSKDDGPHDALSGTTWTYAENGENGSLEFLAGGRVIANISTQTLSGSYTYDAPTVFIIFPSVNMTATGTINGNQMVLEFSGEEHFFMTLYKNEDTGPGGPSDVLLVKQIKLTEIWKESNGRTESETYTYTLNYDSQNRITTVKYNNYTAATFSYSANQIKVTEYDDGPITYTMKLNADGYVQTIIDDEEGDTINLSYENGYLTRISDNESFMKYTWEEGKIVSVVDEDNVSTTYTYDTSHTLVPTNVDLAYLTKAISLLYENDWSIILLGRYGKQCSYPLTQSKTTDPQTKRTDLTNYTYAFNGDGSVAKITIVESDYPEDKNIIELFY
ncbi:MAG: DUF4595 domain-containing protein [Alistipes sp.]|nr:DUF4595 domain-containing protein [Alistipes sp.]